MIMIMIILKRPGELESLTIRPKRSLGKSTVNLKLSVPVRTSGQRILQYDLLHEDRYDHFGRCLSKISYIINLVQYKKSPGKCKGSKNVTARL